MQDTHGSRLKVNILPFEQSCFRYPEPTAIDYPEDYPFPSCLIMGTSADRVLHIVASIDEDTIYLITAYVPDAGKWQADWKTRKGEGDK